jgi:hypothetical protein
VGIAWYLPISLSEYEALSYFERAAMLKQLAKMKKALDGAGGSTLGTSRQDRRSGL